MEDIKAADSNLTVATKGLGDIILKRLNTDSEQAQHGGYTTSTEQQQMMAFEERKVQKKKNENLFEFSEEYG